jgi:MFS family permease
MAFQNAGISTASCPSPPEGGKTACLHEPRTGEGTLDRPEPLHNNGNVRRRTERFSQDDPVVTSRVRRIGTRAMAVVTLIFGIGILACTVGADDVNVGDVNLLLAIVTGITGMGIVGAVLSAKAPQNPLGPAYQVAAMFMALAVLASLYGERGLSDLPGLPLVPIAGWLTQLAFTPAFAATCTAFLLFPDGRPPSTRWRPVMWLIWGGAVVAAIGTTFGSPRFEFDPGSTVANPFRMGPEGLFVGLNILGGAASFLGGILAVISVVVRFRRSKGEERQQLRWLAWAAGAILVCAVALVLAGLVGGDSGTAFELVFLALVISVLVGLPLATAIAVLRYRLYDLDLVVKKTAIYSIVAIALTALYLALLGGATLVGLGPIPAGVVFLLTFTFARNRARKIADRIVYGKRATPFEVLSEFSERVGETYSVDDVLPRMTQLLAAGTGAREARAWIRHGRTLRASAVAPADAGTMPDVELAHDESSVFGEDLYVFPVTHQGELLGAITLAMAATTRWTRRRNGSPRAWPRRPDWRCATCAWLRTSGRRGAGSLPRRTNARRRSSATSTTAPSNSWWRSPSASDSPSRWPSATLLRLRRCSAICGTRHPPPWRTCGTSPGASIRHCSRTRDFSPRSRRRRARRPSPSRSNQVS